MSAVHLLRFGDRLIRLDRDPEGDRAAMVRLFGYALSHDGPSTPELRGLRTSLQAFETDELSSERALSTLVELGAEPVRSFAFEPSLPSWTEQHRIGFGEASELLPFDPEVVGLRLGTRRLAKRDRLDADTQARVETWWQSEGLQTRRAGHCVFGATDAEVLGEAERWQSRLEQDEAEASRALGEMLGYPSCCIDAYLALGGNDDVALASALLPALPSAPASPLTLWLHAPLALVSHAPCSLGCAATLELARRLLAGLEQRVPGFATRWMSYARRVHAFDELGHAWSIEMDTTVESASVLEGPKLAEDTTLVGLPASIDAGGLIIEGRSFGLLADHRGAP